MTCHYRQFQRTPTEPNQGRGRWGDEKGGGKAQIVRLASDLQFAVAAQGKVRPVPCRSKQVNQWNHILEKCLKWVIYCLITFGNKEPSDVPNKGEEYALKNNHHSIIIIIIITIQQKNVASARYFSIVIQR